MGISFDGLNKVITLDSATDWDFRTIYQAAQSWAVDPANMAYLLPCSYVGRQPLGSNLFTDTIYVLRNGWKLRPSGYSTGTQMTVAGTLLTDDQTARTLQPVSGSPVSWVFQLATNATIVTIGSGLSQLEHDALLAVQATVGDNQALILAR